MERSLLTAHKGYNDGDKRYAEIARMFGEQSRTRKPRTSWHG